jgi:hypothetical protein
VTEHIIVGDRVLLGSGFRAARTRLEALAQGGILLHASELAYGEGIAVLVEEAGPPAGLTRLAEAFLDNLAGADDYVHTALRWEAIAADGTLFTALEADLMLAPAGGKHTAIALAGTYRPQPGPAGAGFGRAILRCCAMVSVGSFLDHAACALAHPASAAGRAGA